MTSQIDLHNRLAAEIVRSIVKPPLEAGGMPADVLVLLESVIVGVMLTVATLGRDEIVLDAIVERVKQRLADVRMRSIESQGSA